MACEFLGERCGWCGFESPSFCSRYKRWVGDVAERPLTFQTINLGADETLFFCAEYCWFFLRRQIGSHVIWTSLKDRIVDQTLAEQLELSLMAPAAPGGA